MIFRSIKTRASDEMAHGAKHVKTFFVLTSLTVLALSLTVSPAPAAGSYLNSISCPTATTCYAVGELGTIYKTGDGGSTWTTQTSGTTLFLAGVSCVDLNTCYVVGDAGTVLKTTNGGTVWTPQASGTAVNLSSVSCPAAGTCFAVGEPTAGSLTDTLIATNNGGLTWNPQLLAPGSTAGSLVSVSCQPSGGVVPGRFSCQASGIEVAVGTDANDGGLLGIWRSEALSSPGFYYGASCVSSTNCFFVGSDQQVLSTTNGGLAWTLKHSGEGNLLGVSCPSGSTCFAVGDAASGTASTILKTIDGWTTSAIQAAPAGTPVLDAISCPSATVCYAAGFTGTVVKTTDGGTTWSTVH